MDRGQPSSCGRGSLLNQGSATCGSVSASRKMAAGCGSSAGTSQSGAGRDRRIRVGQQVTDVLCPGGKGEHARGTLTPNAARRQDGAQPYRSVGYPVAQLRASLPREDSIMAVEDSDCPAGPLIRDRNGKLSRLFDGVLNDAGFEVVLSDIRMPHTSSTLERWARTYRREPLSRKQIWKQRHLLQVLRKFKTLRYAEKVAPPGGNPVRHPSSSVSPRSWQWNRLMPRPHQPR